MTSESNVLLFPDRIGAFVLRRGQFFITITRLILQSLVSLISPPSLGNPAIRMVLLKQLYFYRF